MENRDGEKNNISASEYPSFPEFCFGYPLYDELYFSTHEEKRVLEEYFYWKGQYDAFCSECEKETVYTVESSISSELDDYGFSVRSSPQVHVKFRCSRSKKHVAIFYFLIDIDAASIKKIGQNPSLADIQFGDLNRFRGILEKDVSGEFYKAIGLSAHGVGIGAFVYLRRVLEGLIHKREIEAITAGDRKAEEFEGKRVGDRVRLLKGHLPDVLVENQKIYSVLSKGVHELSEQECLEVFPAIRDLMFYILEEDLESDMKRKRLASAVGQLEKFE